MSAPVKANIQFAQESSNERIEQVQAVEKQGDKSSKEAG